MRVVAIFMILVAAATVCAGEPAQEPTRRINITEAALLGLIEGVTEYLPISSTGHLIIATHAMGHTQYSDESGPLGRKLEAGSSSFEIVIQLGAILAVVGLYRGKIRKMGLGIIGRDRMGARLLGLLVIATLPAVVVGLAFHSQIKENLFTPRAVCFALAVGGIAMIAVEQFYRRRPQMRRTTHIEAMAWHQALIIGMAQCLAMWPGTSRSMITIVAGLLVGMHMIAAAEFSFLLALPTLTAATVLELVKNSGPLLETAGPGGLIVGTAISGIVAAFAIAGFIRWLTGHGLTPFGIYRILLAGVVYAYFF
jgi:undecaprenyl-diphosphatase